MDRSTISPGRLYPPGEIAAFYRVDPRTVVRWIKAGKLHQDEYIRTAGGHHRVYGKGILRLLADQEKVAA